MRVRPCLALLPALAFAAATLPSSATAQNAPDPHVLTCGDIATPENQQEESVSNMMVLWGIGYFHGRFGHYDDSNLNAAAYQENVSEFLGAVQSVCPTIPDMLYIDFLTNLGNDFASGMGYEE